MKTVYLVMHQRKPNVKELTRQVASAFINVGIGVSCENWLYLLMGEEASALFERDRAHYDAVVSVGGDGTLLRANQISSLNSTPLLGINVGRVGFLAEIELDQLTAVCDRLQKGEYAVESRMMLEASYENSAALLALNDIVVSRGEYARLIAINAWVDENLIGRYIADGLIVSTPTGSTGYSLSAGGPIVFPGVDCMIISPICAHSLQHRPVVISSTQTVTLELDCEPTQKPQLSVDGQIMLHLSPNQKITITCAAKKAEFIRLEQHDFFRLIRRKLSEWSC